MDRHRPDLVQLALSSCRLCEGTGLRMASERRKARHETPPTFCACVLRAVFRSCFARFRQCVFRGKHRGPVSFERTSTGRSNRGMWSRKEADFDLVARRHLDKAHYRIFRYHFLLGAGWRICCEHLHLDRGNFYHAVYRIEHRVGEAIVELEPYSLYPPREYFTTRFGESVDPLLPGRRKAGRAGKARPWTDRLAG